MARTHPYFAGKRHVHGIHWSQVDPRGVDVDGEPVAPDPLGLPPPPGDERSWLQRLFDEARADIEEAKSWAQSNVDALKQKAKEVLDNVKAMLGQAKEVAKEKAQDMVQTAEDLSSTATKILVGAGLVITSPFWGPWALLLAYRLVTGHWPRF